MTAVSSSAYGGATTCVTALGRGPVSGAPYTATVRTPDGVIEFPTTGTATLGHFVTVPTEHGPRHFCGPDEGGCFREVAAWEDTTNTENGDES